MSVPESDTPRRWESRQLRIGYPAAEHDWEPQASPACMIRGVDVLLHARHHFDAWSGDHYLIVRLGDTAENTSRPVLDDETMADLPLTRGVVDMRLVKVLT